METKIIQLTAAQEDAADWLMGCPIFDEDAASLAYNWDEPLERATVIVEAVKLVKHEGRTLTMPNDGQVIEYFRDYAEQLTDMNGNEYLDELIGKGIPHREAQCKANAAVKSTSALLEKLEALL